MTHTFGLCKSLFLVEISGIGTADLLNAIQALSQLSYTPMLPETLDFAGFLSYSIF